MKNNINIPAKIIYYSDNIDILRGINSNTIDLIYLDPPFNKNDTFVGANKRTLEIKEWYVGLQNERGMFTDEDFDEIFRDNAQFQDIWTHTDTQKEWYGQIDNYNHELISFFDSIRKSAASGAFFYLIFMTIRLIEMRRVLKDTGSIYLHCDPTMSHYIKIIMDVIFGEQKFRNEIIWGYKFGGSSKKQFAKKHDVILYYSKGNEWTFNEQLMREFETESNWGRREDGKLLTDWWYVPTLNTMAKERTGYPTQKPLALLERIITASSNTGDVVLDPFCGCATTCVAAEKLERKWIGVDWNKQAYYMVYYRLHKSLVNAGEQAGLHMLYKNIILETEPPARTDTDGELFYRVKTKQELKTYKITTAETRNINPQYRKEAIDLLYDEQMGFCNGCNEYLKKTSFTLDHIEPWHETHNNDIDNLQLLCYRCNNWKGTGTMIELVEKLYSEKVITKAL